MTVLVGSKDGVHVVDSGEQAHAGREATAAAVAGDELWLVLDGHELGRAPSAEPSRWEAVATSPEAITVVAASPSEVLVGTDQARLLELADGELVAAAGFDDAPGRADWYTPWGGQPAVRSLAFAPDGTVYVNVHVGGLVRRTSTGWEPTIDVDTDVHQVVVAADGQILVATGAAGLATSDDGGRSWRFVDAGLTNGVYARALAVVGDDVLVTASHGPRTSVGTVHRRPRRGDEPFSPVGGGLPDGFPGNVDTHLLSATGAEVVLASPAGDVHGSSDGGRTWHQVGSAPDPRWVVAV